MNHFARRSIARLRFMVEKVPHFLVHHSLRHERFRLAIHRMLEPFPGVKRFLQQSVRGVQQRLSQQRILYQRSIHPDLVIKGKRKASPVDPAHLAKIDSPPYSVDQILKNIQKELS